MGWLQHGRYLCAHYGKQILLGDGGGQYAHAAG